MPRTAIIIQARMASTRLPGKVLLELGETTVLHHVLRRAFAVASADDVCCAIPDDPSCDPVADEATRHGAAVFRGSEADVLSRYAGAARMLDADVVMRVTSDCPLIDPDTCDAVLQLRQQAGADYACNNMPPSFPHGLDCEAFTRNALERADATARQPREREHVTPWMRETPGLKRANLMGPGSDALHHRWTLDYPDDLVFFRSLFALEPTAASASMNEILSMLRSHPQLADLNATHRDVGRPGHQTPIEGKHT
jgi:glutamate-1-semialdehyde 2,1-aminomutase/spore coat polysaccharide biosynthesis protein SpsF